jgi:hypothetical protein
MTAYLVSSVHPLVLLYAVPVAGLVGFFVGLWGYNQATRDAYRRFVAAHQRSIAP